VINPKKWNLHTLHSFSVTVTHTHPLSLFPLFQPLLVKAFIFLFILVESVCVCKSVCTFLLTEVEDIDSFRGGGIFLNEGLWKSDTRTSLPNYYYYLFLSVHLTDGTKINIYDKTWYKSACFMISLGRWLHILVSLLNNFRIFRRILPRLCRK
jgi:hypothetical protein